MKRIKLAQDERSTLIPLTRQIIEDSRNEWSCTLRGFKERESGQQPDTPILPSNYSTKTSTTRIGLSRRSLFPNSEKSPNETCPANGTIYTQNVQGLTGKDNILESLVDPIVDLMINNNIMVYCIQETWTLGSGSTLVQGHMVLRHNQDERAIGTKGRIPGGVAIILSPPAAEAWIATGSKPQITTQMDSPFIGRFIRVKLRYPWINQYKKKVRGNIKLFIASTYHPVDEFEHTEFIDILSSIMSSVPKTAKFIGGHDVNTNQGIRAKMYRKTLGP